MDRLEINPFLVKVRRIQEQNGASQTSAMTFNSPLAECGLDNMDCPVCRNTGSVLKSVDEAGNPFYGECSCMGMRRALRAIQQDELRGMVQKYRLEDYQTPTEAHRKILDKAKLFVNSSFPCFLICGQSGAGKTHICAGITGELIRQGFNAKYFRWRNDAPELKALINDPEYRKRMNQLRNVPVLFIDDLLKGGISAADLNLAYTIIDNRYIDGASKKTVISTELTIEQLLEADEALGGRLKEMSDGCRCLAPKENWRLKHAAASP